jgi:hypothetical protein
VARRRRVELGEHRLLDLQALGHRLDHEVDIAEGVVGGGRADAGDDVFELGVGRLPAQPPPLDLAVEAAGRDRARLLEARAHRLLVDVLQQDGDAGRRDRLGDLAAHRAGADDCGL